MPVPAYNLASLFSTSPHCIDLSDDNSTRTKRWRRHCSVFVGGGRAARPHSPRGPFVLLNLRRVTTRGSERASEGDTKWAPLRSLPLCLCYAGSSSHGTSLAYLLGLTFPRRWWWSTLRFLLRPERLLRLLLISQQPEVPTFSRNTKIAECIWNLASRRVIVQITRFECTFRFSRQEEERGIRV